ncbi:site-2 protease family protein [Cellulomonas soli]|uniref:site-2 protease family protein n=1 Tax=Cellulomonas soli TaxID=931535 RepID=UPI003F8761AF
MPPSPRQPTRRPARSSGWVIGRVVGAPVVLAPSWLVAAVVLTVMFAPTVRSRFPQLGGATYLVALVFVVLLFTSVLVHELAHGLVGRTRGQRPREFVLTVWGGHTSFDDVAPTPLSTAQVAAAGPAANLVLGALAWGAAQIAPSSSLSAFVLVAAASTNGFVAVFNLIPGLPLDGGRVLEAAVWAVTKDRHRGTIAAGWAGRVSAVVVAVGLVAWTMDGPLPQGGAQGLWGVVWAAVIGAFLWSGASAAVAAGRSQRAVEALTVAAVGTPAVAVAHAGTVAEARAAAAAAGAHEIVVVSPDGRPAAYVDLTALAAVPPQDAGTTPVLAVTVPLPVGAVVDGERTGRALLDDLARAGGFSPVVVALVGGRVHALVRVTDVVSAIRS